VEIPIFTSPAGDRKGDNRFREFNQISWGLEQLKLAVLRVVEEKINFHTRTEWLKFHST
jgi:hypothetical protein